MARTDSTNSRLGVQRRDDLRESLSEPLPEAAENAVPSISLKAGRCHRNWQCGRDICPGRDLLFPGPNDAGHKRRDTGGNVFIGRRSLS